LLKNLRIILDNKNKPTHNILDLFNELKSDINKIKISKDMAKKITEQI
jgi:hypothetical protein